MTRRVCITCAKLCARLPPRVASIILVTHYPEDIIPAIDRVLLIKDASIFADGSKRELLCDDVMSDLFDVPLTVNEHDGWYSLYGAHRG